MKIAVYNQQKKLKISKKRIEKQVKALLDNEAITCDEVGVYFVDKKKIQELHKHFFDDPTITDCIAFPVDNPKEAIVGYNYLGDVFICTDMALQVCGEYQYTPEKEMTLYVVHALLHLIGYNDKKIKERKVMRKKEKEYMDLFYKVSR